jgi:hypothetical protein
VLSVETYRYLPPVVRPISPSDGDAKTEKGPCPNAPRSGPRSFADKLDDLKANPDKWQRVSAHTEKATRKGGRRHGASTQEIYRNTETGETLVKHTVTDDAGRVVDEHWRPNYKPRAGE